MNNNKRFVDHLAKSIAKFPTPTEPQVNGHNSTTTAAIITENDKESIETVRGMKNRI